jgi:hypothetical protein
VADLRYLLAIYVHAHQTGNSVPPHIDDEARAVLAQPEPQELPPGYIDAEHTGHELEMLEVFYKACRSEGGTTDEIQLRGLKAVLARWSRAAIEPVPVAERLPGPEDCDAAGRCWWWIVDQPGELPHWIYCQLEVLSWTNFTAWLPHHALPVPQQEADRG